MKYTVDKIENNIAELVAENCESIFIFLSKLPAGTKETDIIEYDSKNDSYIILNQETNEVLKKNKKRLNTLFKRGK